MVATPYNTVANRTPRRVSSTVIYGSTPDASGRGTSYVPRCNSPSPPSVFICNFSIGNIGHTTTPNCRENSKFHASVDRILSIFSNEPSIGSQILRDEFYFGSVKNLYLRCRMEVAEETVQPMGPKLVSHGLPTIDTFKENSGIWNPATSSIRRTPNNTHGSASEHVVGQGTAVGAAVVDYREENYKTDFDIAHENSKFQSECENIELS